MKRTTNDFPESDDILHFIHVQLYSIYICPPIGNTDLN